MSTRLALKHPELTALFTLWRDMCQGETFPVAADLDPVDLRRWLDNLVIVDMLPDGDVRYAFYGGNLSKAFGIDMVGQSTRTLPAEQRAILNAEYNRVRAERLPTARTYTATFDGRLETWERIALPFFDGNGEVEKVMVAAYRLED